MIPKYESFPEPPTPLHIFDWLLFSVTQSSRVLVLNRLLFIFQALLTIFTLHSI